MPRARLAPAPLPVSDSLTTAHPPLLTTHAGSAIDLVSRYSSKPATPDAHFVTEARNNGSKLVVLSPDFSEVARYADWWIPVHSGMDAAFWMAVDHVILQEFHTARQVPYFVNYLKRFSDSPFLVVLDQSEKG